jgi:hypothetical protein
MAEHPDRSLPQQAEGWADLKGAYRFLNNPRIEPSRIGRTHRTLTRAACVAHPVVLCVQDDSDLSAAKVEAERHVMHTTLAVLPTGELLGVLQQRFFGRVEQPAGETRGQRAARWRESDVWAEAVGEVGPPPAGCRFVHVADRGADNLRFMHACANAGVGFVARARHDRRVDGATGKLWSHLADRPVAGVTAAEVGTQRDGRGRVVRRGRRAGLAVRLARVRLEGPWNHPDGRDEGPLTVNAVHLTEIDPPAGVEAVDWMLLTGEPVTGLEEALAVIDYYRRRWVIEEWHRALKEGCRLGRSQLEGAEALARLTAVLSVVAVRMMQLRDLADRQSDDAAALERLVPPVWIRVVAALANADAPTLTPRQFWRTIARRGGWPGRKGDGRPGWKAVWTGWHDVQQLVEGAEVMRSIHENTLTRCG